MANNSIIRIFRVLGIILFVYILYRIDFSQLVAVFREMNWTYYSISIFFLAIWFLVRTFKWKRLVGEFTKISNREVLNIMAKSVFWGVVTPGKLGEFWRAKYLAQKGQISFGTAFYTAFMDRFSDLLILGLVTILGLIVIYLKFNLGLLWGIYIICLFLLLSAALFFIQKMGLAKIGKILVNFFLPSAWQEKTNNFFAGFDSGLKITGKRVIFETFIYSVLYYLSAVFVYYFNAKALGIPLPFWYLLLVLAMVWLILMLPLTFFGLGAREAGFIYFFSIIGISASEAVAFSLLALFANFLIAIPGFALFLWKK
ncbi:MAG: flippase-like domain-containing protein [Candidatus Nealsonbacteria bacterium]|nr:flippase-like domain-containing protein [Candidatus Nealsonbacteria bacterium]